MTGQLNHIDRFIIALWQKNDQLSVYNPQIKTQYDTYSWMKDIAAGEDKAKAKMAVNAYKEDLLTSLEFSDMFPVTFDAGADGAKFIRWALSRDIRNILRWLRGPGGNDGPQGRFAGKGTYGNVFTEIDANSLPLGRQDNNGFVYTSFVDIVRRGFSLKEKPKHVFGRSDDDDLNHSSSNYFWFMYGILPRNKISFQSLKNGLTEESPNENDLKNTFKFLGLLYNLRSEKVEIVQPGSDGKPKTEFTYNFIDPSIEMAVSLNHKEIYVDAVRNEIHQKQEAPRPAAATGAGAGATAPTAGNKNYNENVNNAYNQAMNIDANDSNFEDTLSKKSKIANIKKEDIDPLIEKLKAALQEFNKKQPNDQKNKDNKKRAGKIISFLEKKKKVANESEQPVRASRSGGASAPPPSGEPGILDEIENSPASSNTRRDRSPRNRRGSLKTAQPLQGSQG